jgi:hypothetical protein
MNADDSTIRAWAQVTGRDVAAKGRVSRELRDEYSAAHNGTPPGYPDGMTDDDFGLAAADDAGDFDDPEMSDPEPRPVRPKAASRTTGRGLRGRLKRGTSSGKPKRKPAPRVSTAELVGSAVRIGAKLAQPIPPLYRVVRLQSVIAGPLVDDAVRGTLIDPILQPLARMSRAGQTFSALVLPDAAIAAMAYHQVQAAKAGTDPNPLVMQACAETLRHGLIAMMRIGGDAFAAQLAREREDQELYGADIDRLMAWIMTPPADPGTEEENIAKMAAWFAGEREPEPEPAGM